MARKAERYRAVFGQLEQQLAAGDEVAARLWGLTGWPLNWWLIASEAFAILLVLPFGLGLRHLENPAIVVCGSAGLLLAASWWTRSVLVLVVTSQGQLLCCRISRPITRQTFTQAPVEAARFADFRRGWLYSRFRYRGPGTDGKTVSVNIPPQYRSDALSMTISPSELMG